MKIGFIGLGLMGSAMCENIIKKSAAEVFVYDVNQEASKKLESSGAIVASNSSEIAKECEVIITMVPRSEHVISIYEEMLPLIKKGTLLIEMSTISPDVSRMLSHKVEEKGGDMLDAPVVKSRSAAIEGTLGIYVGGNEEAYKRAKPYLSCMGSNIVYMGKNGNGLIMKLCHNALVAQIQNGVNETLSLAKKAGGINPKEFALAISYGGGQNFYLDSKINAIIKQDFTTAFSVQNMDKDVHLAQELSAKCECNLEGIELTCKRYKEAMKSGLGKEDFCATYKLFQ